MSVELFIKAVRKRSEEIDEYLTVRPELVVALLNDAVSIDKIYAFVPYFAALLDRYGLKDALREEFRKNEFATHPSSLRLLAQVFGRPWQHINLEQALAEAVAATRIGFGGCGLDESDERAYRVGELDDPADDDAPIAVGIAPDGNLAYVVSDEPLTLQEQADFFDKLRGNPLPFDKWIESANVEITAPGSCKINIPDEETMEEHDPVNKPKHYTTHRSGVECIELTEKLSFNLGNAFKYVFRRADKENALQDVSKAEWYLKREIARLEALIEVTPASVELLIHPHLTNADYKKANRVIAAEISAHAADYYVYLFDQASLSAASDLESLYQALVSLQLLIEEVRQSE